MKTTTASGIPREVQRTSWWKSGEARTPPDLRRPLLLIALIALGDAMAWQTTPGLSLAVFATALLGGAALMAPKLSLRQGGLAAAIAFGALLPLIDLVQPLSVLLATIGLAASICLVGGARLDRLHAVLLRLPGRAIGRSLRGTGQRLAQLSTVRIPVRAFVTGWALPLGLGALFFMLILEANPLFGRLPDVALPRIAPGRLVLWAGLLFVINASLVAHRLDLKGTEPRSASLSRGIFFNQHSVTRSLVLFNAIFALQSGLDASILLSGAEILPQGMTYAQYARSGAYPLLATALLAGVFAILARPFTDDAPTLRLMLLIWLGQTLLLVISAAVRLEIYIDVYGLTRLRVAAAIWMALVAAGLVLVFLQIRARRSTSWMLIRTGGLGLATLYVCALLNIDGMIARHNLSNDTFRDDAYVCRLSEGALPALIAERGLGFCNRHPRLFEPEDWREWGFRNWRLRNSLLAEEPRS